MCLLVFVCVWQMQFHLINRYATTDTMTYVFFVTNMNWKTTKYHCHSDKHFTKNNAKYSFNRCWEILNSLRFAHHWQLLLFMLCAVLSKINNLNRELSLFQDLPHHTKYFYILLVKITLIECVSSQINSD